MFKLVRFDKQFDKEFAVGSQNQLDLVMRHQEVFPEVETALLSVRQMFANLNTKDGITPSVPIICLNLLVTASLENALREYGIASYEASVHAIPRTDEKLEGLIRSALKVQPNACFFTTAEFSHLVFPAYVNVAFDILEQDISAEVGLLAVRENDSAETFVFSVVGN